MGAAKRPSSDSIAPLSSKKGASCAEWERGCGNGAGEAEGEGFEFADGGGGAGEEGAGFEETCGQDVAIQVVGEHGDHTGEQRWAQVGGLLAERVFECDGRGLRRREELAFGGARERAGDGFGEAELEEAGLDRLLFAREGVGDGDARGGERVGEAVVAVDAGDFFDQVDFAGRGRGARREV